MNLDDVHYKNIKSGNKKFEIRVFDIKRQKLKLLDKIEFINKKLGNKIQMTIIELKWFNNFKSALEDTPIEYVLPGIKSLNEGVNLYESFPNYKENADKYGVIKIGFN